MLNENPLNSLDLGDLTAVTEDITIPTQEGVTWSTSDAAVVTTAGKITRSDETKTATLTAKMTKDGVEFTRNFDVTVLGYTAVIDSFKAYADGNKIVYASDYDSAKDKYAVRFHWLIQTVRQSEQSRQMRQAVLIILK